MVEVGAVGETWVLTKSGFMYPYPESRALPAGYDYSSQRHLAVLSSQPGKCAVTGCHNAFCAFTPSRAVLMTTAIAHSCRHHQRAFVTKFTLTPCGVRFLDTQSYPFVYPRILSKQGNNRPLRVRVNVYSALYACLGARMYVCVCVNSGVIFHGTTVWS